MNIEVIHSVLEILFQEIANIISGIFRALGEKSSTNIIHNVFHFLNIVA